MAPPRRAASPNTTRTGWLSHCRRSPRNRSGHGPRRTVVDPLAAMPDDLLYDAIFSRLFSDAAAVARCAAVCRRWGRVVAAREAAISRALPPPGRFLPNLALGFFHGGSHDDGSHRRRRLLAPAAHQPDPYFVPTSSASALLGSPFPRLPVGSGAAGSGDLFHYARPVASRGGRVVFELLSEARADGVALSVCNPMTGDVALVPPLAGGDFPGHDYACVVLTANDLDGDAPPPGFFSLILVYNRRGFTALRCYSSGHDGGGGGGGGRWGPEARKPGAQISGHVLRGLGPAVVLRGVAYWPILDSAALAARLDIAGGGAAAAIMDVRVLPYRLATSIPDWQLLGTTPDGNKLRYVSAAVEGDDLGFLVETLETGSSVSTVVGGVWATADHIVLTQFRMSTTTELKLRWLGEKSGTLLFTIGRGGGGNSGAFALNLGTRSVEKLADGVECNSWRNMFGYEMDSTALLASITARFNSTG
ncbi:unnamed protein product [Urochloa humidicola]